MALYSNVQGSKGSQLMRRGPRCLQYDNCTSCHCLKQHHGGGAIVTISFAGLYPLVDYLYPYGSTMAIPGNGTVCFIIQYVFLYVSNEASIVDGCLQCSQVHVSYSIIDELGVQCVYSIIFGASMTRKIESVQSKWDCNHTPYVTERYLTMRCLTSDDDGAVLFDLPGMVHYPEHRTGTGRSTGTDAVARRHTRKTPQSYRHHRIQCRVLLRDRPPRRRHGPRLRPEAIATTYTVKISCFEAGVRLLILSCWLPARRKKWQPSPTGKPSRN
jgi:hypothetical protein